MGVKSSGTVFQVLARLTGATRPLGAAELAADLSVPVTTAARALATLAAAGFAERHQGSSRYVLGKVAHTLAYAFMAQFPIRDLAMPYLQRLTLETGQTSSLFVRLGWYGVRIASIHGTDMLARRMPLGESHPLPHGAPGQAMLSGLSPGEAAQVLSRFRPADPARWEAAASGPGVLARPLLSREGRVLGAVAVEDIPAEAWARIAVRDGPARRIMAELAVQVAEEATAGLSHYEHIDPTAIDLGPVARAAATAAGPS